MFDMEALFHHQGKNLTRLAKTLGMSEEACRDGGALLFKLSVHQTSPEIVESFGLGRAQLQANVDELMASCDADIPRTAHEAVALGFFALAMCRMEADSDPAGAMKLLLLVAGMEGLALGSVYGAAAPAMLMSALGRRGAIGKLKRDRDGKQAAKAFVKDCWKAWQDDPGLYDSAAAFARAMLEKFPDILKSQPVIEAWVRSWRAKLN